MLFTKEHYSNILSQENKIRLEGEKYSLELDNGASDDESAKKLVGFDKALIGTTFPVITVLGEFVP